MGKVVEGQLLFESFIEIVFVRIIFFVVGGENRLLLVLFSKRVLVVIHLVRKSIKTIVDFLIDLCTGIINNRSIIYFYPLISTLLNQVVSLNNFHSFSSSK